MLKDPSRLQWNIDYDKSKKTIISLLNDLNNASIIEKKKISNKDFFKILGVRKVNVENI